MDTTSIRHYVTRTKLWRGGPCIAHNKYFRANALTQGICVTHRTSYTLTTTVATAGGATTKSAFWIATAGGNAPPVVSRATDCTAATADSEINSIIGGKTIRVHVRWRHLAIMTCEVRTLVSLQVRTFVWSQLRMESDVESGWLEDLNDLNELLYDLNAILIQFDRLLSQHQALETAISLEF